MASVDSELQMKSLMRALGYSDDTDSVVRRPVSIFPNVRRLLCLSSSINQLAFDSLVLKETLNLLTDTYGLGGGENQEQLNANKWAVQFVIKEHLVIPKHSILRFYLNSSLSTVFDPMI